MPEYEITSPNGKKFIVTAPEGASESDVLNYAKSNFKSAPMQPKNSDGSLNPLNNAGMRKELRKDFIDTIGAGLLGYSQGRSFGLGEEALSGLTAIGAYGLDKIGLDNLLGGESDRSLGEQYDAALSKNRQTLKEAEEANPVAYYGGMIGGGIKNSAAINKTRIGKELVARLGTGGRAARALKTGAAGALSGGATGFTTGGGGFSDRMDSAGLGAFLGGAAGGVVPVLGGAVQSTLGKQISKIADVFTKKSALKSGEITKAQLSKPLQKVFDKLRAEFPNDDELMKVLNSYSAKSGKSLIEKGGKRIEGLAEIAALSPSGAAKADNFFSGKIINAGDNMKAAAQKAVSRSTNQVESLDELVKAGREKASPFYKTAYSSNQAVDSKVINRILETPTGRTALKSAVKKMQDRMALVAKPDKELTAAYKELVDLDQAISTGIGVAKGLKLETLDLVKRNMDDVYEATVKSEGYSAARGVKELKKGLTNELKKLDRTGAYKKALATSGDYLSSKEAMEEGVKFLNDDYEMILKNHKSYKGPEKEAYKVGVIKSIREKIDSTTDGSNVANLFNKEANRKKFRAILKPAEYDKLLQEAKATDEIYKLRNKVIGGSQSARRLANLGELEGGEQTIVTIAQKGFTGLARDKAVGFVKQISTGLNDKLAGEVSDILYTTDPKEKFNIVKQLTNQIRNSKNQLRKTEAAKKLKAFYEVSDYVQSIKVPLSPFTAGAAAPPILAEGTNPAPTKININPEPVR